VSIRPCVSSSHTAFRPIELLLFIFIFIPNRYYFNRSRLRKTPRVRYISEWELREWSEREEGSEEYISRKSPLNWAFRVSFLFKFFGSLYLSRDRAEGIARAQRTERHGQKRTLCIV